MFTLPSLPAPMLNCSQLQDAWSEMASIADEINQRKKEYEILQEVQANLTGWNVSVESAQYWEILPISIVEGSLCDCIAVVVG